MFKILIPTANGLQIPLSIGKVEITEGPNQIQREDKNVELWLVLMFVAEMAKYCVKITRKSRS
jgi:Cu/Ag efflux pump CusA